MNESIQEKQSAPSAINEVDALFAHGDPKPSALSAPLKRLEEGVNPLRKEYDDLQTRTEDPALSDMDKDLLDIEMKDLEAQMVPRTARIDRIGDYIRDLKTRKTTEVEIARAEVEYGDRRRVEKDIATLRSKVTSLADRTRNGLSNSAAAQTRNNYLPIKDTFDALLGTDNKEQARKLAEEIIGELKPVLLAMISGFEDIKDEMLDRFVEAAKQK